MQRLVQGQSMTSKPIRVPTLLSRQNRSAGRDRVRTMEKKAATPGKLSVPPACHDCGVVLEDCSRVHCDDCLPAYKEMQAAAFGEARRVKMGKLRVAGKDPSKGDQAKGKAARRIAAHAGLGSMEGPSRDGDGSGAVSARDSATTQRSIRWSDVSAVRE